MRMSIVIPTHNRRDLLRQCLAAATQQDYPDYEVIVVDDSSSDGTGKMVRQEFNRVCYIRQESNRGPAAARNRGIAVATGEIVAFTDDDCLLPTDFLSQLAAGYQRYPEASGAGGYLEPPDSALRRSILARYEAYVTHHVYGAGPEHCLGGAECPAGGTNSMSYRRHVLDSVQGFDESFPVPGGEDTDLKRRVVAAGGLLLYVPIKVIHLRPYTVRGFWRQYHSHGRGVVHFERKHRGAPPSKSRLLLRLAARLARWARDLLLLGPPLASARLLAELADLAGQCREVQLLDSRHPRTQEEGL